MTEKKIRDRGYLPSSSPDAVWPLRAKKSLGQNFLVDNNIARKIVEALNLSSLSTVVEIGPGRGALTRLMAETGARIEAVEKDFYLYRFLKDSLVEYPGVNLVNEDFLTYRFPESVHKEKVVGNIPYNLTSEIISRLVDYRESIDFVIMMLQDEVAQRLSAAAGTKQYGALSVRLQLVGKVEKLFRVSPNCFKPKPNVESRVVRINFIHRGRLEDEPGFVRFVKLAFSMRRKMFRNFVSHYFAKQSLSLLDDKVLTSRVEIFTPADLYSIFLTLRRHGQYPKIETAR